MIAGSGLIAIAAQVRIPLPFSPVPVTGVPFIPGDLLKTVLAALARLAALALPAVRR